MTETTPPPEPAAPDAATLVTELLACPRISARTGSLLTAGTSISS